MMHPHEVGPEVLAGTAVGAVLDDLDAAVAGLDLDGWGLLTPVQQRAVVARLLEVQRRVEGVADAAVARAEHGEAAQELGCTMSSWLALDAGENARVHRARVRRSTLIAGHRVVEDAVLAGGVSVAQARVICEVIDELPVELGAGERAAATSTMLELAAEHAPAALARLGGHLLEVVAPDRAEELEGARLEAEEARAARTRELHFVDDGHGVVRLRGRLPVVEARVLRQAVEALARSRRRTLLDAGAAGVEGDTAGAAGAAGAAGCDRDGAGGGAVDLACDDRAQEVLDVSRAVDAAAGPSTLMPRLRADALVELARIAGNRGELPALGGDRPRVQVLIHAEKLRQTVGTARTTSGEAMSLARARQLACDAGVLPVVLDSAGVPLDVGREQRLFTGGLRTAVLTRDGGCVFPGCDRGPEVCDVHHITPWWAGGKTSLANGVALCPHHHGLVEPRGRPGGAGRGGEPEPAGGLDRFDGSGGLEGSGARCARDQQWQVRLAADGLPEFIPPVMVSRDRSPRVHARLALRRSTTGHDPP